MTSLHFLALFKRTLCQPQFYYGKVKVCRGTLRAQRNAQLKNFLLKRNFSQNKKTFQLNANRPLRDTPGLITNRF